MDIQGDILSPSTPSGICNSCFTSFGLWLALWARYAASLRSMCYSMCYSMCCLTSFDVWLALWARCASSLHSMCYSMCCLTSFDVWLALWARCAASLHSMCCLTSFGLPASLRSMYDSPIGLDMQPHFVRFAGRLLFIKLLEIILISNQQFYIFINLRN